MKEKVACYQRKNPGLTGFLQAKQSVKAAKIQSVGKEKSKG
ncbi:hypothetical protein ACYSJL_01695 [Lactobacillus delbrueckii]